MSHPVTRWFFAVAVLVSSLPAIAQEALPRAELDSRLDATLYDISRTGTILYNGIGNEEGCFRLYEGALRVIVPLLDHRKELQKSVKEALDRAAREPSPDRSFTLRQAIEDIRAAVAPPPPEKPEKQDGSPKPGDPPIRSGT